MVQSHDQSRFGVHLIITKEAHTLLRTIYILNNYTYHPCRYHSTTLPIDPCMHESKLIFLFNSGYSNVHIYVHIITYLPVRQWRAYTCRRLSLYEVLIYPAKPCMQGIYIIDKIPLVLANTVACIYIIHNV